MTLKTRLIIILTVAPEQTPENLDAYDIVEDKFVVLADPDFKLKIGEILERYTEALSQVGRVWSETSRLRRVDLCFDSVDEVNKILFRIPLEIDVLSQLRYYARVDPDRAQEALKRSGASLLTTVVDALSDDKVKELLDKQTIKQTFH